MPWMNFGLDTEVGQLRHQGAPGTAGVADKPNALRRIHATACADAEPVLR